MTMLLYILQLQGRQIIEENTIDHEVDEDKIRQITSNNKNNSQFLAPDLLLDSSADRDVAPGVNAPLLKVIKIKIIIDKIINYHKIKYKTSLKVNFFKNKFKLNIITEYI